MNAPPSPRRSTAAVVMQSLLWLWLACLSVFMFLGQQTLTDLADRERVDTGRQRLEAQVASLAETTRGLQQRPAAATAAGLQDTREALEARIAQVEQAQSSLATEAALQALRAEIEQIKTRQQTAARAAAPTQARSLNKAAPPPAPPPFPLRVVGAEMRAGRHSLSVAPATGAFSADQIQVLLPGDTVGSWRLQAIEGNTAVFQAGEQIRRMAIP